MSATNQVAELEYRLEAALIDARRQAARSSRHPPAEAISEAISAPRQMVRPQPTPRGQPPLIHSLQPRSPPQSKRGTQLARHQPLDGDLMDRIVVMRHWDYFNHHIRE